MRSYMADLQGDSERDFVRNMLASGGFKVARACWTGAIWPLSWLPDSYSFSITFEIAISGQARRLCAGAGAERPWALRAWPTPKKSTCRAAARGCYGYHSYETCRAWCGRLQPLPNLQPATRR